MRFMIACAAAALLSTALPADTARAVQASSAATAPSERQLELTRRYLNLLMTDQFEGVIHQMLGAEMANDEQMQTLPEADRRFILSLTAELTADMVPQMIAEMVPVYAGVFTEEELVALVAFYDTPLGRSIAEKSVQVMPAADRAVMALVPQMMEKMAMRMCQHYSCTPAELEQLRQDMREGAEVDQGARRK